MKFKNKIYESLNEEEKIYKALHNNNKHKSYIKQELKDAAEFGHPYEDWEEFSKLMREDGFEPTEDDEKYFYSIYDTIQYELDESADSDEYNEEKIYKVSHSHNGVPQAVMIKASSEEEAEKKYYKKYPDGQLYGISKLSDYAIKDYKMRGMGLIENRQVELANSSDDDKMTPEEMKAYWITNRRSDPVLAEYDSYADWYKDSKDNGYVKLSESIAKIRHHCGSNRLYEAKVEDYIDEDTLNHIMNYTLDFGSFDAYRQLDNMIIETIKTTKYSGIGPYGAVHNTSRYWKFDKISDNVFEVYEMDKDNKKIGDTFKININ